MLPVAVVGIQLVQVVAGAFPWMPLKSHDCCEWASLVLGDGDVLGFVPWGLESSCESIGDVPEGVWADESDGHVDVLVQLCNEGVVVSFPRSFSRRSVNEVVSSPCVCDVGIGIVPKRCGVNGL